MAGRLQQQAERLARSRAEILDESGRKRAVAEQAMRNTADNKRQRVDAGPPLAQFEPKPLPPGPHSLATVFTLGNNRDLAGFDVTKIPAPMATKISVAALASLDVKLLEQAMNAIRSRLNKLHDEAQPPAPINAETVSLGVDDEDDDYEPDFYMAEDNEQILNKLDSAPSEEKPSPADDANSALTTLRAFKLPPPPVLDADAAAKVSRVVVSRLFAPLINSGNSEDSVIRRPSTGLNRLAASSNDRDSLFTVILRLATRSTAGLEGSSTMVKAEETKTGIDHPNGGLGDFVRQWLFSYILEDFRRHIDRAVNWLSEEWLNDQITKRSGIDAPLHYDKWTLKLVDGFLDYLTPQDKVLTRFLSEIPALSKEVLSRVKSLCSDPTRVQLALKSLLYLVMMRPPARELALDTVAEIWQEGMFLALFPRLVQRCLLTSLS
jgi:symplekin